MIFNETSPGLYDNMGQHQISTSMNQMIADQAANAGTYTKGLIDRRKVYDSVEDGLIKEANNYDSDARMGREVGRAKGDVEQSFSTALGQMQRQMASTGVDPTSGAALAAMRQMTAQKALGIAGAANGARRTIEDSAFQRRMAVGGLGKGLNADITNSQAAAGKLGETAMTGLMDANTRKESAAASMASAAASSANAAANMALANSKMAFERDQWEWGKTNLTKAQQEDVAYRNKTADGTISYNQGMLGLNQDKQTSNNIAGLVGGIYTMAKDGTLGKAADWLTGGANNKVSQGELTDDPFGPSSSSSPDVLSQNDLTDDPFGPSSAPSPMDALQVTNGYGIYQN